MFLESFAIGNYFHCFSNISIYGHKFFVPHDRAKLYRSVRIPSLLIIVDDAILRPSFAKKLTWSLRISFECAFTLVNFTWIDKISMIYLIAAQIRQLLYFEVFA